MRSALFVTLLAASSLASADPKPAAKPEAKAETAKPEAAKTETPAPTICKRTVVGRGADRHVVCEVTAPVVIHLTAPAPNVLVVHDDPRKLVGRPRSSDRFSGLDHTLR
jgi:hypothetical protein